MSDQNPPTPPPYPEQPQYSQPAQPAAYGQPQPYGQPGQQPPAPVDAYGQPVQPAYGYKDPYAAYPQRAAQRTNTLAIVALVLSLTIPIGGIVCGHIALGQIKRTGEAGHGMALAGLIIGYAYTALVILAIIAYIIFIVFIIGAAGVASTYSYNT